MVDMSRYNKLRINPDRYNYDLATNLPLRRTFWRIADKTVLFNNKTYCILAIDIENFHLINKWYGRETGDELLIEIGKALKMYRCRVWNNFRIYGWRQFLCYI